MISRTLLTVFLSCFLCACSRNEIVAPPQGPDEIASNEYAVLAAIVDSLVIGSTITVLIVRDSTSSGVFSNDRDSALRVVLLHASQEIPALRIETMEDFKAKNLRNTHIRDPSRIHPRGVRASTAGHGYPVLDVGRVGFSSDGQQALAYVGFLSAPLAGTGDYYVLARQSGQWVIIGRHQVWIS